MDDYQAVLEGRIRFITIRKEFITQCKGRVQMHGSQDGEFYKGIRRRWQLIDSGGHMYLHIMSGIRE